MICAACQKEFVDKDGGLFKTCAECRMPDKKKRKPRRFGYGHASDGRTQEHKEDTRETKFGRDQ